MAGCLVSLSRVHTTPFMAIEAQKRSFLKLIHLFFFSRNKKATA
jgi:hypothetical protein